MREAGFGGDSRRRPAPAGVYARIRQADARADAAFTLYEKTVLLALEETENALVDYGKSLERERSLAESERASREAAELARLRRRRLELPPSARLGAPVCNQNSSTRRSRSTRAWIVMLTQPRAMSIFREVRPRAAIE